MAFFKVTFTKITLRYSQNNAFVFLLSIIFAFLIKFDVSINQDKCQFAFVFTVWIWFIIVVGLFIIGFFVIVIFVDEVFIDTVIFRVFFSVFWLLKSFVAVDNAFSFASPVTFDMQLKSILIQHFKHFVFMLVIF